MVSVGHGTWRSLVSALDWGSRGREFKSPRPDLSPDTWTRSYHDTGVTVNDNPQVEFTLDVTVPGKEPYKATLTQVVSRLAIAGFQPGATVPVRVSPDDPQVLMIG